MSSLAQLRLLLWKNFTIHRRRPVATTLEIIMPILFMCIMVVIRQTTKHSDKTKPASEFEAFNVSNYIELNTCKNWTLAFVAESTNASAAMLASIAYLTTNMTFTVFPFKMQTEQDIVNFIVNNQTISPGCGIGVVLSESEGNFHYRLRLDSTPGGFNVDKNYYERIWYTEFSFPPFQGLGPRDDGGIMRFGSLPGYAPNGFLAFQHALNMGILSTVIPQPGEAMRLLQEASLERMPYPSYIDDSFIYAIQFGLPLLLMLAFLFSAITIVRNIVHEKERRLKESMKMMGLKNWLHWTAWFIQALVFLVIAVVGVTILFKVGSVLQRSDPTVIFVYLLLFAIASIQLCFLISVFFTSAATGSAAGGIIWFCTYVPYFYLANVYQTLSFTAKQSACLLSTTAMAIGAQLIAEYESRGDGVQWSSITKPVSSDDPFTFGAVLGMLLFDAVYYFILSWYIEGVFPGKYGIPRPWYFPFQLSYWFGTRTSSSQIGIQIDAPKVDSTAIEPDPSGLHAGVSIRNLRKVFGDKVAVAGTSLNLYEGQITALLGHNGAGKTTTMSMITGLFPPTSGTAIVNGFDICTDIGAVQKSLGICPQHDVLFDTLTVEEHLWFFCKLKGVPENEIKAHVDDMIEALELPDKRHAQSKTLSGGMKRKLSCAIALVGGSKVVILDEPTSGMDPAARRATWDLLTRYKAGRTIILSTHFLDEADLLGDRIAIMSDGVVQCAGTSLFLKSKYGVGYNLVLVKKDRDSPIQPLDNLVKRYVPEAKMVGNVGMEVTYLLPRDQTRAFPPLFNDLEAHKADVHVDSYGIAVTTLEEVFLKVGEGGSGKDKIDIQQRIDAGRIGRDDVVTVDIQRDDPAKVNRKEYNSGWALKRQQLYAMFVKRLLHSKRNKLAILPQLLVPLLFVLIGLLNAGLGPIDQPPRSATSLVDSYGRNIILYTDKDGFNGSSNPTTLLLAQALQDYYSPAGPNQILERIPDSGSWGDMGDYILRLTENRPRYLADFNKKNLVALSFAPSASGNSANIRGWFNGQAYHTPSEALAAITSVILTAYASNASISFENAPLPRSNLEAAQDSQENLLGFYLAFDMLFGMAFLASSFVLFLVAERANKAKHIQFVSGVDILSYWTASYVWDFLTFLIPLIGSIILFAAFNVAEFSGERLIYISILFIMYGLAIIPMMYLASFFFDTPSTAYTRLTMFNIITGLAAMLAVSLLSTIRPATGNKLKNAFLFLPNFCFGQGLSDIYSNYQNLDVVTRLFSFCQEAGAMTIEACCSRDFTVPASEVPFDLVCNANYLGLAQPGIGSYLLCLGAQAIFFFALTLMVEARVFSRLWDLLGQSVEVRYRSSASASAANVDEDVDVASERARILAQTAGAASYKRRDAHGTLFDAAAGRDVLVVKDLTKVYKTKGKGCCGPSGFKVSVDHMYLGIPHGECFGLLGVNGAGKTTTFNMLTGDVAMTLGTAIIDTFDIRSNMRDVRQRIGYCPQFDGLIELMTGRELLTMYARLRGVPEPKIDAVVTELIYALMLEKHADRYCGTYSGGNKRKLSTAVALVGDPLIVFLDEPTSGMDAGARRFLWDALMKVMEGGRSIVLTSHSMEECEALCTRLAIMVNGRFQCLGSIQHLKSRFGQGFSLMAKVAGEPANTAPLKQFVKRNFPSSNIKDEHRGMVHFELSGEYTWSQIFSEMEKGRESIGIVDYSVGQTSLEQVFLDFAKHQHEDLRQSTA